MEVYWKTIGAALITAVLVLTLERSGKDFSLIVTLAASVMITAAASSLMQPVAAFFNELESLGDLNSSLLLILLKVFGTGVTGEIASSVCTDSGNSSLGKGLRFLSNAAILYLSLPLFSSLIDLIQQILLTI